MPEIRSFYSCLCGANHRFPPNFNDEAHRPLLQNDGSMIVQRFVSSGYEVYSAAFLRLAAEDFDPEEYPEKLKTWDGFLRAEPVMFSGKDDWNRNEGCDRRIWGDE